MLGINDWRNAVFESELTPKARLVALALAKYYRQGRDCYPSYSALREDTGYTNNHTIGDAIKELESVGFIRIRKGKIKNLSIQSQSYEFVGVQFGEVTGEVTGEKNSPEIREEENKRNKGNNIPPISPKKIKTIVDENWQPDDATKQKLESMGLDVPKVVEKFINACQAKGLKYVNFNRAILSWDWSKDKSVQSTIEEDTFGDYL